MGNKKLKIWLIVFVLWIVWFSPVFMVLYQHLDNSNSVKNPEFDKTILIMEMTPVDNEPGAYVLEYSNGTVEVLHADGTRELLKEE